LLDLWERSVRATHHFLGDQDIVALRPQVRAELASDALEWWVLESSAGTVAGLLGFVEDTIEGLFIDPDYRNQGAGKSLVAHAQRLSGNPLTVDVNEQNDAAVQFYIRLGFTVVGRSATDGDGRPFPLLHMKRDSLGPPSTE
jgi:putative acetyltransferase